MATAMPTRPRAVGLRRKLLFRGEMRGGVVLSHASAGVGGAGSFPYGRACARPVLGQGAKRKKGARTLRVRAPFLAVRRPSESLRLRTRSARRAEPDARGRACCRRR